MGWLTTPAIRHPRRFFVAAAVCALVLMGAERGLLLWRGHTAGALHGAHWIWAHSAAPDGACLEEPIAFYAAADFEVQLDGEAPPEGIRLSITADEEYGVYLNGSWVGGGSYRGRQPVDRYRLDPLLRNGTNRIVVELRSVRGVGGFLARVSRSESEEPLLLTSTDTWRIFRRYSADIFRPEAKLDAVVGAEPANPWRKAPTGRWRIRTASEDRPNPFMDAEGQRTRAVRFEPVGVRHPMADRWVDLRGRRRLPSLGPQILLDWGREISGFLYMDLPKADHPPALAWFGSEPPDAQERPPDRAMIFMPGLAEWRDVTPRCFRYVLLVGVQPATRIMVRGVEPAVAEALAPAPRIEGLFGIRAPQGHTRVEEWVWDRVRAESLVIDSIDGPSGQDDPKSQDGPSDPDRPTS